MGTDWIKDRPNTSDLHTMLHRQKELDGLCWLITCASQAWRKCQRRL